MCRVARNCVLITEPSRAVVTEIAVRTGHRAEGRAGRQPRRASVRRADRSVPSRAWISRSLASIATRCTTSTSPAGRCGSSPAGAAGLQLARRSWRSTTYSVPWVTRSPYEPCAKAHRDTTLWIHHQWGCTRILAAEPRGPRVLRARRNGSRSVRLAFCQLPSLRPETSRAHNRKLRKRIALTPTRMTDASAGSERSPAAAKADELLHILQRRWRTVIAIVMLVGTASYGYSASQTPRYAASADVLLSRQDLGASVNNLSDTGLVGGDLNRVAQTEANLATAPAVISRTLKSLGLPRSEAGALRANATVTAKPTADILTFRVLDRDAAKAVRLAGAYARSYTIYRRTLDSAGVDQALKGVRARLATARAARPRSDSLITSLRTNEDRLSTLSAFQGSKSFVVRSPREAVKASPRPRLALLIGVFFGGLLGIGAALVRHRFDTRVQDPDEVSEQLGLPLLATIPELPKKLRQSRDLVMLTEPHGFAAEAFRVLRTNIEFANIDGDAKTIMVSSALQAEGKSTTVANLAIAFARGGKRVVLVDLDLRRPYLAKFFGLQGRSGISEVALGRVPLSEALCDIDLSPPNGRTRNCA